MRASGNRCPECGTVAIDRRAYLRRLSTDWPVDALTPRRVEPDELPELLLDTADGWEADLLVQQLTAWGILSFIEKSGITGEHIPGVRRSTFFRVVVYTGDLDDAREYLRRAQNVPEPTL